MKSLYKARIKLITLEVKDVSTIAYSKGEAEQDFKNIWRFKCFIIEPVKQ